MIPERGSSGRALAVLSLLMFAGAALPAEEARQAGKEPVAGAEPKPRVLLTPSGVRFALLGEKGSAPAPTLFVFATGAEETLSTDAFVKVGRLLVKQGFLCVSLDLPCHGEDRPPKEPLGLAGWRARLEKGDDLVPGFTRKASVVLDFLVKERYTDPEKVAACGTSRGGFIALHLAAAEPRVRCVAAFAPVTDLLVLREFKGAEGHAGTKGLALAGHAEKLAGRAVWVCIGNHDERVGTDHAIAFTRKLVEASVAQKKPAAVELHVLPVAGHRVHATAHEEAAAWILARIKEGK